MLKRSYVFLVLIALSLVSGLASSCDNGYEKRIAELEQEIQELHREKHTNSTTVERDVKVASQSGLAGPDRESEIRASKLDFQLRAGDRVEGEVSLINDTAPIVSWVTDPYGNPVVQTWFINQSSFRWGMNTNGDIFRYKSFPWRFAFIASTDGSYELGVAYTSTTSTMDLKGQPIAHLKIMYYTND